MKGLEHMYLENKKHLHFIGIGGSGMYPMAQILHGEGYYITGSDNNETDTLQKVREMGIPVTLGQKAENIEGADLIIYTAAIMADNPELIAARESGIPTVERSIILGEITARYENALCVSGTHGKTTTTSMLTQILFDADLDPTCVIGGKLAAIGGSGRAGKSDRMVCESCEFVDTFLKLYPDVAVILNIDADHLDYFKTMENLMASFRKFAEKASRMVIYNGDDENTVKTMAGIDKPTLTFGYGEQNDFYAANIRHPGGVETVFDLMKKGGEKLCTLTMHVPGDHNVLNAVAACVTAMQAEATPEDCVRGIDNFHGTGRRFEVLSREFGITVADDYAHHPTEVEAVLKAAKTLPFKRIWAVHQPFTYSRTHMLMDDFARVLQLADKVVLSEVMGSREKNTIGVYTSQLAEKIPGCVWYPAFPEISDYVAANAEEGDLILTLGCGDVNKCARMIIEKLHKRFEK
ncbi:MAG: UDP-N-acetylmuramate--L-alanine ligase [Oscillospiraceae bacterium]|nr:UDP-N-acetylmuramate--L-alanine ligase [Oscillospiraceae bacterium]